MAGGVLASVPMGGGQPRRRPMMREDDERRGARSMTSAGRGHGESSAAVGAIADVTAATRSGGDTSLDVAAIDDLRAGLRGELIRAGDGPYDEARTVWNLDVDK